MSRGKYNQGRITDYSGSDMADPKTRKRALEDYIGRTGWKMTQVQRSEMAAAASAVAGQQIAEQTDTGRARRPARRLSVPAADAESEPLTLENAWKLW
jgi:hypothetical protein